MATENQIEVKETINAGAKNKEVETATVEEKPVKKSKNIAVIFAILGVSLTFLGILLPELINFLLSGVSIGISLLTIVPILGTILAFAALLILYLFVTGTNIILSIIDIGGLVFSILALVLNRKKKDYLPTTLGCISVPLSTIFSISAIKATISSITSIFIFALMLFIFVPFFVLSIVFGILSDSGATETIMAFVPMIM